MNGARTLLTSTIGKKFLMGITGFVLVGFLVAHMLGNILIFAGSEKINAYGEFLQHGTHGLIWGLRGVLLASVGIHIWAAVTLTMTNSAARKSRYAGGQKTLATTPAAKTMRYGGTILLAFIFFHLAHMTFGVVHSNFITGDVYHNLVTAFQVPWVAGVYLIAMLALGPHLYHGTWSMLQSVGLSHPQYNDLRKRIAVFVSAAVVLGNCSIVIAVLTHLLDVS